LERNIILELVAASKLYTDNNGITNKLFENISFVLKENTFVSIISASGRGKSTLLKVIAGFDRLSSGELKTNTKKKIIYIPSKPSLLPGLNVIENICRVVPNSDADIAEIVKTVGLNGYETFRPDNRSFEIQLRISLARALASQPSVILLDEPFYELSPENKKEMYILINKIYATTKVSFILSTTNIAEAVFLSDEIFLFQGKPSRLNTSVKTGFDKNKKISLWGNSVFLKLQRKIEKILAE